MKVTAQYAQEHLAELLETADHGEEVEIARDGKPSAKLIIMPSTQPPMRNEKRIFSADASGLRAHPGDSREPVFGAGRGEIVLPTDQEWKAMDRELEDSMLNGSLFPSEQK